MNNDYLSKNLVYYRKKNNYSQEQLAEKLHVSRQAISRWECGTAVPDTENLIEMGNLYGVSLDELIKGAQQESDVAFEDTNKNTQKDNTRGVILSLGFSVIAALAFLLWGMFVPSSWGIAWICFLAIPLLITAVIAIKKRRTVIFCYPVVALAVFYALSWYTGLWHPLWIIFLTIPIYYCISILIDKNIIKKEK